MTRRRWIADEFFHDRAALTGPHAAHLSRTLRARVGQEFEVACGEQVRRATVASVSDDRVEFALGEEVAAGTVVPITLLLAVFKFDRMEWAIEKCTELNVTTIVPVIARRTEKHLALAAEKRVERWRRIAREASEQSRRIAPPEIAHPVKLKDALEFVSVPQGSSSPTKNIAPSDGLLGRSQDIGLNARLGAAGEIDSGEDQPRRGETGFSPGHEPWVGAPIKPSPVGTAQGNSEASGHLRLVLSEAEREAAFAEILQSQDVASLALAIGPEGGWTEDELQSFGSAQWIAASLGNTILRAETAAIAALAIARAEV